MHPYATLGGYPQPTVTLYHGEVLHVLASLPERSVHAVITSPPYWGLRAYLDNGHQDKAHELGSERTLDCLGWATRQPCSACYVCRLVQVGRELWRVLREDGTFWLNLGTTMVNKQDAGTPWRCALALQADGWYLRSEVIWAKRNPLPESVQDRVTRAHEQIFMLTKSPRYFYDAEAVKTPSQNPDDNRKARQRLEDYQRRAVHDRIQTINPLNARCYPTKSLRSVWSLASEPTPFAHFATYPTKLVEPCILAGSPTQVCRACGAGWQRVAEQGPPNKATTRGQQAWTAVTGQRDSAGGFPWRTSTTTGFTPTCPCAAPSTHATVLDPFVGSGTTALVAVQHGRDAVGIDLNRAYLDLVSTRLTPALAQLPLFGAPAGGEPCPRVPSTS